MNFTKVQGAGNDFVLIEGGNTKRDWSQLAKVICDRHYGVGADGLLVLLPSKVAHFKMRVFDPDGFEAEACGNGLRCMVKYALQQGLVERKSREVSVETIAGVRKARLNNLGGNTAIIKVSMGEPRFGASDIPVAIKPASTGPITNYPVRVDGEELRLDLVSMGNPHAVYFWQHPVADFPLSQLGPRVEYLPVFPNRVNFEVARVISRGLIEARVWERGAGETLACGSGACAIAVFAQLHDYAGKKVDIKLPGGTLVVEWDGAEVFLSGPAEIVFSGELSDEIITTG